MPRFALPVEVALLLKELYLLGNRDRALAVSMFDRLLAAGYSSDLHRAVIAARVSP